MKTFVDAQMKHAPSNVKPRRASRAINPLVTCAVIAFVGVLASIACTVPSFAQIVGTVQLNIERRGHTATLLEDGKVLIVGGDNQSGIVNQVELLDPASQTSALAAMPIVPRTDHTATRVADGRVLIIGGHDRNGSLTSTEIYNPLTATFTAGPSLTTPRSGHTATVLANGNILVAGGDASGSAELYNPTTQRFSLIAGSMNTARKFQSAILLNNGQVLIAGGVGAQNNVLNTAEVYDPSSQSFYVPPTDMQTPRALAILKLLSDGKVQIIGGDAELSMEVFDPTNGIFIAKALLPPNADLLGATLSTQSRAALFSPTISQDPLLQGVLTPEQLALLDRADHSITELPSRNQALVAGGINSAGQTFNSATLVSSSTASVTTDKTDYAPGEIVTIIGGGFQPNEQVQLSLHEFPEAYPDITFTAVANQQGNFVATDFAPQLIDLDRIFTLTAIGQSSGFTAQTAFKDAAKTTSTSVSCSPSSVGIGSSSTCTATVTNTGTGNNTPDGTVNFTSSGSGTFTAPSSCTLPSNPGNNLASCSVAYTPSSGAGTHTITGTYVPANTANFSGSAGRFGLTVTVTGTAPTITSSNNTTFTVGTAGSFTVTTTGSPTPAITKTGTLPTGITFIDNSNGTATLSGTPALGTAGSYPITITANNGVSPNATQNFTLTVQRATPTVSVTGGTFTYDGNPHAASGFAYGVGGISDVLSPAVTFSYAGTGSTTYGPTATVPTNAGTYQATASFAGNANYNSASNTADITINKKNATWTTNPSSKIYGDLDPVSLTTGNGSGFLMSDGVSATYTRTSGESASPPTYHITATLSATVAGALNNYNITNNGAEFTINKKDATWTTNPASKTYGELDPSPLTTGSGSGFVDAVTATYSRVAGDTVAGSPFHISAALNAAAGILDNYNITNNGAEFTINKKDATWTTNPASKTYGELDPSPLTTGSGSGFVDAVTATYSRVAGDTVAGSPFHISAALNAAAGILDNYNITNNGADFTINKKDATWTTNPASKTYSELDPSPLTTGSGSGFVDAVTATYSRVAGETVAGSPYHISAALNAAAGILDNYNITNNGADFTINKKDATWTTNPGSKTYGELDPSPLTTGSGSGFVDAVTATYSRVAGETVAGSPYHISAALNAAAGILDNYNITNNGADFTIYKRPASVTPNDASKLLGAVDLIPLTTGTLTGFLLADGVTATYSRTLGETIAGNPYTISAMLSPAGVLGNYDITYNTAKFYIYYKFNGFFRPIDNLPIVNIVSSGSSVPIKFSLTGYQGTNIFATGYPRSAVMACNGSAPAAFSDEIVTPGSSGLSYDPGTDQYIYVWKTEKAWSNSCRRLAVMLNDGQTYYADFNLKK